MAAETFPVTGTRIFTPGAVATPQPNILRTNMEAGPPKQALKGSRQHRVELPVRYRFEVADWPAFKTWWRDDINNGADWFNWWDAEEGTTKDARMVGGAWSSHPVNPQLSAYIVEFTLEITV